MLILTVTTLKAALTTNFWPFGMLLLKPNKLVEVQDAKEFDNSATGDFPTDSVALYYQAYFEALDLAIIATEDRFVQPGFHCYQLEDVLKSWTKH